ncbi:MAG TPA: McrC family protein [Candidatus Mucispirillum faecigallinarum]|uniref:McrC family protein n=1 Tax=Candidatus Mucispirillum faecigallinarum TaxID=2838699 RepID=A0A9D2GU87_9BACT|nr:McrC family protein [Candidatus Mucispirillum faecigallinarum]
MSNEYSGITTDNRSDSLKNIFKTDVPGDVINELKEISGKNISDLKDKEGFLIYCNEDKLKDDVEKSSVFTISDNKLTTHNIAGFIGTEHTFLTIRSRFARDNSDDYFLHYMLQKVFNINITNLEHNTDKNKAFQFLPYLFKYYFLQALNQGLYKKYVWKKYNDSRVKGTIDIARHIKHNFIFTGNIAYNVREHSYDNNINQLIRHTIEYIDNLEMFRMMLESEDMADLVQDIRRITPTYSAKNRQQVINDNLKSDIHPYYSEYEPLRQICLQILMEDDELKYGRQENKIYGILFDVSWLWEEYLNTLIEQIDKSFIHTYNKSKKNSIHMLENNGWSAYPDYYSTDLNIVMDAKYKRVHDKGIAKIDSEDRMQIISYMHILGVNKGVFLHPSESNDKLTCNKLHFYHKENIDECIMQYSFRIPYNEIKSMNDFKEKIMYSEEKFIKYWKTVFKQNNENKSV